MTAAISRASRSISIGLRNHDHEVGTLQDQLHPFCVGLHNQGLFPFCLPTCFVSRALGLTCRSVMLPYESSNPARPAS